MLRALFIWHPGGGKGKEGGKRAGLGWRSSCSAVSGGDEEKGDKGTRGEREGGESEKSETGGGEDRVMPRLPLRLACRRRSRALVPSLSDRLVRTGVGSRAEQRGNLCPGGTAPLALQQHRRAHGRLPGCAHWPCLGWGPPPPTIPQKPETQERSAAAREDGRDRPRRRWGGRDMSSLGRAAPSQRRPGRGPSAGDGLRGGTARSRREPLSRQTASRRLVAKIIKILFLHCDSRASRSCVTQSGVSDVKIS
ncbi:serine/arginine repetitive matrix protein 3-like [Neopsephotus bourkii]|uniref:serine/arginine repetitive matrix protein 3-like n=1 Tax=Neopsephotus bourkii TaxID=309878 RepID=UPI002AA5C979|nr:serine/arginine repetitive matrix protein 3-like [Neopsephotus bourkii]